ncbi:MAG: hypothetical protein NC301_07870 [Bacteroides sp.]|nr:hypothetical protein [Bacteroides sp.]MCM1380088.1 hypothetical protein [Bacteroides sp.]MCM1446425.1 hypothetical protein [Prevotella sp.]
MKKITLALSALMLSASGAMALDYGCSYVLVPADASVQAVGKYLAANADGSVSYTNELSSATLWEYSGEQGADFNFHEYITNGGKYLKFSNDEKATLSTEVAETFPTMSSFVDEANCLTNYYPFAYPAPADRAYLNAASLSGEPENSAACAYYFIEATSSTTAEEIEQALFPKLYPYAKVIAVGGTAARTKGKYMSIDDSGKLTTSNTLDLKAAWNMTYDEDGNANFQNLSTGNWLYTSDLGLSATPVPLKVTESEAVKGAFGITSNLEAAANQNVWLNALNTRAGIGTWDLDAGSSFFFLTYTSDLTAEEVDNQVDVLLATPAILARAEVLLGSTTIGLENKSDYTYAINSAQTLADLTEAGNAAVTAALQFAQEQISSDFGLYVNSLEQYINYVAASENTPFQRQPQMTATGLWKAEWVEEPSAQDNAESSRTFNLYNTAAKKYVGSFNFASNATAVDAAEAAKFSLIAGNTGFAIKIVGTDNYLSTNTSDAITSLTSWSDVNDVNSQFSFFAVGEMTQDETYATFAGTTGKDAMGGTIFTSINAVEIMVPVGATLTDNGAVKYGTATGEYDDDWQPVIDVKKTWTAADLKAVTPAQREVTRQVYDNDIWDYVTVTATYDVYTLPLGETYTEKEVEYVVKGDAGLFTAVTADGFKVSCPLAASEYIETPAVAEALPVTPASGTVEEITEIVLGAEGWYVNPEADGKLTVTYNGTVAKDANGDDIDVNADEIDVKYFYYDNETFTESYSIPVNFTEAGVYKLTIAEGIFINEENNSYSEAVDVEWTIEEEDGINEVSSVKVNGCEIYDLQGRKVAKAVHGLYIINGKKVIR